MMLLGQILFFLVILATAKSSGIGNYSQSQSFFGQITGL